MRRIYTLLSPIPVLEHYHPYPKRIVFIDAQMLSASLPRIEKMRLAPRPPLDVAVAARAVYLLLKSVNPVSQDVVEVAVTLAATEALRDRRRPVDAAIRRRAESIIMEWNEEELMNALEWLKTAKTVVSPLTLLEYLTSPVMLRRLLPPEMTEMSSSVEAAAAVEELRRKHAEEALAPADVAALCEAAEKLAAALEAGEGSAEAVYVREEVAQLTQAAKAAALAAAKTVSAPVLNSITTRLRAEDDGARGQKTQGNAGWAEALFDVSDLDCSLLADPAARLAELAASRTASVLRRFRWPTRMLRRDRRISSPWLPGPTPTPKPKPVVVIGVDVSGSIDRREAAAFANLIREKIAPHVDGQRSRVVFWSTRVEAEKPLTEAVSEREVPTGGGTDPASFLEYVDAMRDKWRLRKGQYAILMLTDGVFYIDDALASGLRKHAREAAMAYAVITGDRVTAEKLRQLGWMVDYAEPTAC